MSAAPDKLLDKTILPVDVVLSDSGVLNEPCLLEVNFADESFNGPECFNFLPQICLIVYMDEFVRPSMCIREGVCTEQRR